MKRIILTCICLALTFSLSSQKLVDLYKKGTIRLVPDTEYAKGNDWNNIFRSYWDSTKTRHRGASKTLVLMPDGSVVVNHESQNYYSLFSPQGTFVKEFTIKTSKGKPLKKSLPIEGIINGNTFFTGIYNPGYVNCFDFNGKWTKTLKMDYTNRQMIALPNRKIAIAGWSLWKDATHEFVTIVDYDTNEEKIVWSNKTQENRDAYVGSDGKKTTTDRSIFNYSYQFETSYYFNIPSSNEVGHIEPPIIACSGNKLLVALSESGEIREYDLNGKFLSKKRVNWPVKTLSVSELKQQQQERINDFTMERFSKSLPTIPKEALKKAHSTILREMKEDLNRIIKPMSIPCFSTIIKDSDGNLLFFEYPKEEARNVFHVWVYANGGSFVCQSSFVCDDYDLIINPSRMVFHKGYLYSLQKSKQASGVPLRLVRFKLTAN